MYRPNISGIHNCYGCGVCSIPCPVDIIDLRFNSEGFYEPYLTDPKKCVHCGMCRDVCAYTKDNTAESFKPIASYAAWSKDKDIHKKCSSGGVGFEIAHQLLDEGYKVVGVKYNIHTKRAEHYISSTIKDLVQTIGSKYIQSYTINAWKDLNRQDKYLITGTPCQIDSFRYYMKRMKIPENKFILLDFFCHGVPSMLLWKKYCTDIEKKHGKITYVSWRNKWNFGWHDSWIMGINTDHANERTNGHDNSPIINRGEETFIQSRFSQGDKFYRLFLSDLCLGRQCYLHCKYKYANSSADVRIGDLWGKTYEKNQDGVSAAIAFTESGKELLMHTNCELKPHPLDLVAEGQMKVCPPIPSMRDKVIQSLQNPVKTIGDTVKMVDNWYKINRIENMIIHPIDTFFRIIRRIERTFDK